MFYFSFLEHILFPLHLLFLLKLQSTLLPAPSLVTPLVALGRFKLINRKIMLQ